MKLPKDKSYHDLQWLLEADLSDYRNCGKAEWMEIADHYRRDEPWWRIPTKNPQTQAILIALQGELRREALRQADQQAKRLREEIKAGREREKTHKAALRDVVYCGGEPGQYAQAWLAWRMGDERRLRRALAAIEQQRAKWKQNQEAAERTRRATRNKRDAETLRNRAANFVIEVNWFENMPVYNHWVHNDAAPWGYCQATGQDRWKVKAFLQQQGQQPVENRKGKGAGRPLPLYGFDTNMLVLDKWLGDWLVNSPHDMGKVLPEPERVCGHIAHAIEHAARCDFETVDPDAKRFRALLADHWRRWWPKVKDDDLRGRLELSATYAALTAKPRAWRDFCAERRARWAEIIAGVRAEPQPTEPMPYKEVWEAYQSVASLLK